MPASAWRWLLLALCAALCTAGGAGGPSRRLQACGTGCIAPWLDDAALSSAPAYINVATSSSLQNYRGPSTGYSLAYGVCWALDCNYRNLSVEFVAGNEVSKTDLVYSVTFYALQQDVATLTALPAALAAALPATQRMNEDGLLYGVTSPAGGALSQVASVSWGWGAFAPPPSSPLPPAPPGGWRPPPPHPPGADVSGGSPPPSDSQATGLLVGLLLGVAAAVMFAMLWRNKRAAEGRRPSAKKPASGSSSEYSLQLPNIRTGGTRGAALMEAGLPRD